MSKPATRNAWNKPLAAPPGLVPATKKPVDIIMRERFLHLMLNLVGQTISITLKSGAVIEGIMHTFTPFESLSAEHLNKYVIKSAKVVKGDVDIKGGTLIVGADKVSNVHIKSLRLEQSRHGGDSFQTDTDISAGGGNVKDDLVVAGNAWTTEKPSNGRAGMFGTKNNDLSGGIGEWDQFHANETQFGVKASFDENLYTTSLDKTTVDKTKQYEAERMAREIEGKASSNMHVAEERGQAIEGDFDEEDLYSGVLVTGDKKDTKERTKLVLKPRTAEEEMKKRDEEATSPAPAKAPAAPAASAPAKTMNWAAMVAKSDKKGAAPQETKEQITTKETTAEEKPEEKKEPEVETKPVPAAKKEEEPAEKAVEPKVESKEAETDEKPEKPKSKLSAKAKSFSFNPSAKTFTPNFSAPAPQPTHIDPQMVMMQQQYMQYHPAGVPGPMMYPGGYPPQMQYPQGGPGPYGMMQRAGAPPPQGQVVGPNGGEDAAMHNVDSTEIPSTPVEGGEASNENSASTTPTLHEGEKGDEGSSEQPAQAAAQQPKQQGMPAMAYPGGPSGYYNGGNMPAMAGRGPGQQHYHPQMVAPQVIPRGYVFQGMQSQPMHQGNMPQYNMGVPHFIPGQPYMQGGYPAGRPMEGDDMGYRGGGRGGGRGGRGRRSGRGRGAGGGRGGKYNANFNGQNQARNQDGAPDISDGTSQQHGSNHSE